MYGGVNLFFRTGMVYVDDSTAGKEELGLWDVPAVPSVSSRTFVEGYMQTVGGFVSTRDRVAYIFRYFHRY